MCHHCFWHARSSVVLSAGRPTTGILSHSAMSPIRLAGLHGVARTGLPCCTSLSPTHSATPTHWQAADLISRIAPVMKKCDEEKLLAHLGVVLYENLGEEYPGELIECQQQW